MRCSWIPREEWAPDAPTRPCAGVSPDPDICPGYAEHDARVAEAFRAWSWWDKGQLTVRFPDPSEQLMQYVELANGAIAKANEYYIDEVKKQSERNRG